MLALLAPVLSWLGSLLGGPFITAALNAYKAKLNAEDTAKLYAAELAGKELELQAKEAALSTQYRIASIGKWYEPDHLMGYAVAIYFGKLLFWDKVLGWGTTDPLAGWAATTANLIVVFYFGKRGIENVMKILKGF